MTSQGRIKGDGAEYFLRKVDFMGGPYDIYVSSHMEDVRRISYPFERTVNMTPIRYGADRVLKKFTCYVMDIETAITQATIPLPCWNAKEKKLIVAQGPNLAENVWCCESDRVYCKMSRTKVFFLNKWFRMVDEACKDYCERTPEGFTSATAFQEFIVDNRLRFWTPDFGVDHLCHNWGCFNWEHHSISPDSLNRYRTGCPGPYERGCYHDIGGDECIMPGIYCTGRDSSDFTEEDVLAFIDQEKKKRGDESTPTWTAPEQVTKAQSSDPTENEKKRAKLKCSDPAENEKKRAKLK